VLTYQTPAPAASFPALDYTSSWKNCSPFLADYLQLLSPGASTWNEEQSRKNFDSVRRYVIPGDPAKSRILIHPLAESAGGDDFHGGGRQFASRETPEWRTIAAWIRGEKLQPR
jgi:hypothetical protein